MRYFRETNGRVRRYSGEDPTSSLQGSLLTSTATAGEEAFSAYPSWLGPLAATPSSRWHAMKSYLGMKDGYIPDEQPVSLPRHVGP